MKVALAQINTTVGDFAGNVARLREGYEEAAAAGAEIVVAPELAITGYPPRDLLLKSGFVEGNLAALDELAAHVGEAALVVGHVGRNERQPGRVATNAVSLIQNGKVTATRTKSLLPTYDVFDEDRYFEPATENAPVELNGHRLGLTICEDVWNDEDFWDDRRYRANPVESLVKQGAELLINVSASPWSLGKNRMRREMLEGTVAKVKRPLIYCNAVGGNDELIFDGGSLVFNAESQITQQAPYFSEAVLVSDLDGPVVEMGATEEVVMLHDALVLGVRDYLGKCGFTRAVIGLSGGIDSAVTAAIAVDALGAVNVWGVSMPSQYSSQGSLDDSKTLANNLGIQYDVVPIKTIFETLKESLSPLFENREEDVAEENMQARLRGLLLMALSNKFGPLVLTTGNKSELAVGYCTLYGDMCGGLAVISDVPKTLVYHLADWINREREVIPEATIKKPPSAELWPDQKDEDSLPPYKILDAILDRYVVGNESVDQIIAAGFNEETVCHIVRLIDLNEYKRRQAAPGLKVASKAFGVGRRIPVAQKYQG
ncbi:MAG: NAD+ synthase [Verrucomicrobiota bacterium]|jgi:NAD+ synthetase|nr:NAD+ synthase [Verrucomicrobiota bacterium]